MKTTILIIAALLCFVVAAFAIWHALHDPQFWGMAIVAVLGALGGVFKIAKDFGPENAKRNMKATREGLDPNRKREREH